MNIFKKAIKEVEELDKACEVTHTPPPPPTSGSNAVKPPNVDSGVQTPKRPCIYATPCGWCTKWDKKCKLKIRYGETK